MTHNTRPIQFPISPDKTYVARNGAFTLKMARMNDIIFPFDITYSDGAKHGVTSDGRRYAGVHGEESPYDFIAEVITEQIDTLPH